MDDQTLQQAKQDFDANGFAVIRGFYSSAEMDELQAAYENYITNVVDSVDPQEIFYEEKGKPETLQRLAGMNKYDPFFQKIMDSKKWVGLAKLLLDDEVKPQNVTIFNKPPRVGKQTPPHQDGYYWMLDPCVGLTYWMAMDRVDQENGCLRFVKGSHKNGYRPHKRGRTFGFSQEMTDFGEDDIANEVAIELEPGDLSVHHGQTIHRADPNPSDRMRRGLGFVVWGESAKEDKERREEYHKQLMSELAAEGKI